MREISLREISNATKISIRMLEAIESNNYNVLPGGIFNRNFLRAYADFIGIDPEEVVRKYELLMNKQAAEEEEALKTQGGGSGSDRVSPVGKLSDAEEAANRRNRMIVIAVVAVLVIAAVLVTALWKPGFYWKMRPQPATQRSQNA